jgi:NTE family protein
LIEKSLNSQKENDVINNNHKQEKEKQIALVLQGGGAMGAYEVGVLKAIVNTEVKKDRNADGNYFNVIAGSSIGAINGAILVQEFVKGRSWTKAVAELELFWRKKLSVNSFVDNIHDFSKWWQYWASFNGGGDAIASSEAARRYYSALQFWLFGIPGLFSSSPKFDNRFLDPQINVLQRGDWSAFGDMLEHYKRQQGFTIFPIKTDPNKDPRLLTTAIDVKNAGGVIFDSYSTESSYSVVSYPHTTDKEKKNNEKSDQEITIKYPEGLTKNHIMASAAIPANTDYELIEDTNSIPHRYWDGAFASNTPLRGLIQSHRDWYLAHGGIVPNLDVYIIGLWPRSVRDLPLPPDNNFIWSRMWDLIFDDKTTYVEKTSEMVTDYLDIIEKLRVLAEENGHKEEVDKFLMGLARSKHRNGEHRKRQDLLEGRFDIKIKRIEISEFKIQAA